ncbi:hypothetical protein EMIHUDRAFT_252909, partial [Emiliania huxleyi CCMP1516]|uniref:Uncharacterized protein n=2 Tax=Emiliania huxleyi TaxID=2903 RepID=A0A0D3KF81_EMIH1
CPESVAVAGVKGALIGGLLAPHGWRKEETLLVDDCLEHIRGASAWLARGFSWTEAHQAAFDAQGFLCLPRFLSRPALDYLRAAFDFTLAHRSDAVHPEWLLGLHEAAEGVCGAHGGCNWMWELATQPALLDMLRRHVGPDVVLFSTQLAFKPPACDGGGEAVPWHVDGDGRCRTVWLPLDDVDEGSGGLMVLPGRHAAGRAPFRRLRTASDVATFRFYHKYSLYEVDVSQAQRRPWASRTEPLEAEGLVREPCTGVSYEKRSYQL